MTDPQRDFTRTIRDLSGRHHAWRIFSDFCEMAAIALTNPVQIGEAHAKREAQYLKIAGAYDGEEMKGFGRLLGITTMALEAKTEDFLGQMFMTLELYNHWRGQYFTPMALSRMIARLTTHEAASAKPPMPEQRSRCFMLLLRKAPTESARPTSSSARARHPVAARSRAAASCPRIRAHGPVCGKRLALPSTGCCQSRS